MNIKEHRQISPFSYKAYIPYSRLNSSLASISFITAPSHIILGILFTLAASCQVIPDSETKVLPDGRIGNSYMIILSKCKQYFKYDVFFCRNRGNRARVLFAEAPIGVRMGNYCLVVLSFFGRFVCFFTRIKRLKPLKRHRKWTQSTFTGYYTVHKPTSSRKTLSKQTSNCYSAKIASDQRQYADPSTT